MLKLKGIVFCLTCVALSATSAARLNSYKAEAGQVKEFQMERVATDGSVLRVLPNDMGNATNCGDKSYKFQFQWSPAIISTQDTVTFYWDLVAPNDWSSGTIHLEISLNDDPQSVIFAIDQEVTCTQLKAVVTCPVTKGDENKGQITFSDLSRLPTGKYNAGLTVKNDQNLIVICARGTFKLIK